MKTNKLTALLLPAVIALVLGLALGQEAKNPVAEKYAAPLKKIFDCQTMFASLDPAVEKVYPVAIVENKTFYVFEPVPGEKAYRLVLTAPDTYNMPVGVRAAMPLGFWENRIACVVTPDVFSQPDGYVIIFHEFVHCAEWYGGEQKFKAGLSIFQEAMKKQDYMWELQYPFPYSNPVFAKSYRALIDAWEKGDVAAAASLRADLYDALSPEEWEYLTWQEWKEGLARNLENRMRHVVGLPENMNGRNAPYDRVTLYVGGDKLIRFLGRVERGAGGDLEALYKAIKAKPVR
jgi:hypothetical protein